MPAPGSRPPPRCRPANRYRGHRAPPPPPDPRSPARPNAQAEAAKKDYAGARKTLNQLKVQRGGRRNARGRAHRHLPRPPAPPAPTHACPAPAPAAQTDGTAQPPPPVRGVAHRQAGAWRRTCALQRAGAGRCDRGPCHACARAGPAHARATLPLATSQARPWRRRSCLMRPPATTLRLSATPPSWGPTTQTPGAQGIVGVVEGAGGAGTRRRT